MRIVLIGRYGEGDVIPGPERVARELFEGLKVINPDIVFIEYFFKGYIGSSFMKRIFGHKNLNSNDTLKRLGIIPLLYTLITLRYDIIHFVNIQRFNLFIFLIKPLLRVKFAVTLHGILKYELRSASKFKNRNYLDLLTEKLAVKKCGLIIFPSGILMEKFSLYYKIKNNRRLIIPNGAGKSFFNSQNSFAPVREFFNLVFYNGFNDSLNRGLNDLYGLFKESKIRVRLFVLGDPVHGIQSAGNLEVIYKELKNHTELIEFLKGKQFVIKADSFDPFSIFTAECMALGLIPIITPRIGIKDFIQHGVNGFIYNSSDSDFGLVKLLEDIWIGKYDLNSISRNAKKICEQLNWSGITSKYIGAYKDLL